MPRSPVAARPSPGPRVGAVPPRRPLEIGVTEQFPGLLWAPGERSGAPVPEPWATRAAQLRALRPRYFRLLVDWGAIEPTAAAGPDLDRPESGCLRARRPCLPFAGLRERLRALAARQRRDGGWETLVVPYYAPAWVRGVTPGCGAAVADPRARAPVDPESLARYRRLIRAILAAARAAGAQLRWWSPWNEPNNQEFLAPQRTRCAADAPLAAVGPYVAVARALRAELDAAPGRQDVVVAETIATPRAGARATPPAEFVGALPRDLVCRSPVLTTHGYVRGEDPVGALAAVLARRGCPRPVWITETGINGGRRDACRRLDALLRAWEAGGRVAAAFNYTFRTDDRFRSGLVSTNLATAYPTLRVWEAWAARPQPPPDPCPG